MSAFHARRAIGASLMTLSTAAAADTPADYTHILPLNVGANQAVVQLKLPRDVYLAAQSPGLNDLRVFDAVGASMPFALVNLAPLAVVNRPSSPVGIFEVHGPAADAGRMHDSLQIRTGTDGAVISVTAPSRAPSDALVSLVLDVRASGRAPNVSPTAPVGALALSLPVGTGSYSAWVALDVSDDLQRWDELAEAAVSWLVNDAGGSVQKHRIEFAPRLFRYARLRWLDGKPIAFSAIHAEYVVQRQATRALDSIVLPAVPSAGGRDLIYTAPVAIPAQSLGFVFKGQNVVMPVLVGQYGSSNRRGSGTRSAPQLLPLVNATFYQMVQDGRRRASGDIDIPVTHAAQWVVRPQTDVQERPALRLRWAPANMVFVAGGTAPYRLAFGRPAASRASVALDQVAPGFSARELTALEPATPGSLIRQRAPDQSSGGAVVESTDRRRWLWGVLVAGVAALAAMAWHLLRQLRSGTPGQPPA